MPLDDLKGKTFGRLTVVYYAGFREGKARWLCICSCGNKKFIAARSLKNGDTTSCGCFKSESVIRINQTQTKKSRPGKSHGLTGHRFYAIWNSMVGRCHRPGSKNYSRYGAKGITVCDEWRYSPTEFIAWCEQQPYNPDDFSIDRIKNDLPYGPDNCRLATSLEQQNNRTNNRMIEYQGQMYTMANLIRQFPYIGISASSVQKRIKAGWDPITAITTPRQDSNADKPVIKHMTLLEEDQLTHLRHLHTRS